MRSLCLQPKRQSGFTLLELLVVVVIVAILFTYTTLAIRSNSPEDIIQEEAQRLERLVQLALEEAILRGEEYGIEISSDGYLFLRFTQNRWTPVTDDKILRRRELPLEMELEMRLEDTEIVISPGTVKKGSDKLSSSSDSSDDADEDNNDEKEKKASFKPQIFLLSSGEITPEFEIRLYILGIETSYIVNGRFDGSLSAEVSDL